MNTKAFKTLLDRLGTDFAAWPAEEAEQARKLLVHSAEARQSYDLLLRVEGWIDASRPEFAAAATQTVIQRALAGIAAREASPSPLERFRRLLFAPLPRAALALSLAGIGFAVGIFVGNPNPGRTFDTSGSMMTASVDDVLF